MWTIAISVGVEEQYIANYWGREGREKEVEKEGKEREEGSNKLIAFQIVVSLPLS